MDRDMKCSECSSRNLNYNSEREKGEIVCEDCGGVMKSESYYESTQPTLREGDETRAKGPIKKQVIRLYFDEELMDGDRIWNLPSKKIRVNRKSWDEIGKIQEWIKEIEEEMSQIELDIDEINIQEGDHEEEMAGLRLRRGNLEQEKNELQRDASFLSSKIHGTESNTKMPPKRNEDWMFKHQARDFLRLDPGDGNEELNRGVKELCPEINWVELVTDIISNPVLPDRAPEGDD